MQQASPVQPLTGITVIDLTQITLGPCGTQVLGDYGANVIKIERPGSGDMSRTFFKDDPDGRNNPIYACMNRNKRSLALDLSKPEGKEVLYDLVRTADVVVNNFRSGVMERMGFGYDKLAAINPRIISAFGSGYGKTGPLVYKGGQDAIAQAMSGVLMRRANPDEKLSLYGTTLCDYTAGMHLVQAILLALLHRERTGKGQEVVISLFESMLHMQMQEAAMWMQREYTFNWGSNALAGVFETTDGHILMIGAFRPNPLRDICVALEIPDMSVDPRFATRESRLEHKAELQGAFAARIRTNTSAFWLQRLDEHDLLCSPVLTLAEALDHEQTAANGSIITIETDKPRRYLGSAFNLGEGAFQVRVPPPDVGAHTDEILAEANYPAERIRTLRAAGIVA